MLFWITLPSKALSFKRHVQRFINVDPSTLLEVPQVLIRSADRSIFSAPTGLAIGLCQAQRTILLPSDFLHWQARGV